MIFLTQDTIIKSAWSTKILNLERKRKYLY